MGTGMTGDEGKGGPLTRTRTIPANQLEPPSRPPFSPRHRRTEGQTVQQPGRASVRLCGDTEAGAAGLQSFHGQGWRTTTSLTPDWLILAPGGANTPVSHKCSRPCVGMQGQK